MFPALMCLWLILSGDLSPTTLVSGAVIGGLITAFCVKFMGYDPRRFYSSLRKTPRVIVYLAVLLREILKENLDVLRFIYRKGQPEPMLVHFRSDLQSEKLRVLVANSITLTPGTFTVRLEGDEFAVHALDGYFQVDIEHSAFSRLARKVEEA